MSVVLLVVLFLLIAINGFFVAAEFALVRVKRARMEQEAAEGDKAAARVVSQLDRIDEALSACQVGIMVVYDGRVVEAGPVDEIFRDPQHDYLRALLRRCSALRHGAK